MASEAAIKAATEYAKEFSAKCIYGVASWCIYDSKGKRLSQEIGRVCHAGLRDSSRPDTNVVLLPVRPTLGDAQRTLLKWMCLESPASVFVMNKESYEEGVVFDAECAGLKITFWFAKTMRYLTEEAHRCQIFHELYGMGVHPITAIIAASGLNYNWLREYSPTHAFTFSIPDTIEELREALTRTFPTEPRPWRRKEDGQGVEVRSWDVFYTPSKTEPRGTIVYPAHGKLFQIGKTKQEKKSDGWGGYQYVEVAQSKRDIADHLIELTNEALAGVVPTSIETPAPTEGKDEKTSVKEERTVERKARRKRKLIKRLVGDGAVKPARRRKAVDGGVVRKRAAKDNGKARAR